jgi:pimeloyl-ACP methyl ester carboxylesterase
LNWLDQFFACASCPQNESSYPRIPLSGASWEKQIPVLLAAGRRVIIYDRRGFGKSSQPTTGYNYDTFAEDLHKLVTHLKLGNFALVGFSMGGGEVARYVGKYGSKNVSKAVIIGGVPPFLLKTADNPEGVDGSVFEGIQKAVAADRYAFFTEFFKNFYNTDLLLGKRISEQAVQAGWNVAATASATASLACVPRWHEDFRKDMARIDVPTLVIHGGADRIVPLAASGQRTAKLIKGARLVVAKDGPHAAVWTHADEVNAELVSFLGKSVAHQASPETGGGVSRAASKSRLHRRVPSKTGTQPYLAKLTSANPGGFPPGLRRSSAAAQQNNRLGRKGASQNADANFPGFVRQLSGQLHWRPDGFAIHRLD